MPYSTISIETTTPLEFNQQLVFSNMELHRDLHVVIIKLNVMNNGMKDEAISNRQFKLSHALQEVTPGVSYVSELNKQGKLWSWLKLKPGETCTIMLRYQLEPKAGIYDFIYSHRHNSKLIKRFHLQ